MEPPDYCREIEAYLCRKNDGHLIRVTGPSFDLVAGWAERGVPIKVAFKGIDRYFERYYRNGPRRRPVQIDFCEADVLDVFDEWRRALLDDAARTALAGEADDELAPFRGRLGPEAFAHARDRAIDRLVRERYALPVVAFRQP